MIRKILLLTQALLTAGCSAGMIIAKRDTSETGRGTVSTFGNELTASIGSKNCKGNYASVRDRSELGLINAYLQTDNKALSTIGTIQNLSTTGYAKGILTCNDGDLWRCEVKHDGPSGYGVCIGKDGTIYDIVTGVSM